MRPERRVSDRQGRKFKATITRIKVIPIIMGMSMGITDILTPTCS
jgi:hypothetical protein